MYISDHVHLFDELTVNDHLKMVQTDPKWMDQPLDAFGLSNEANKKAKVLSIGQRKRLALLMRAEIVFNNLDAWLKGSPVNVIK